jgi:hypothetical protein
MQDATDNLTLWLFRASAVLATLLLAWGYGLHGLWTGMGLVLLVGLLWLVGQYLNARGAADLALMFMVGLAAAGLMLGFGRGWALAGVVLSLVAWDLDHFLRRLSVAERVEDGNQLAQRHLWRLLAVALLGGLLGAIALGVRVRLSFGLALLLAVLVVLGLSRVIRFLRRAGH